MFAGVTSTISAAFAAGAAAAAGARVPSLAR
jgi:hypothetical protein